MLVITGASGFIGSQMIPLLAKGEDLLLVARDLHSLDPFSSDLTKCTYEDLSEFDLNGATVLHLAVRNNDRPGDRDEFFATNVDFMLALASTARAAGAQRFINLCSTHALDPGIGDHYGQSKKEGARRLRTSWPEGAINLYIPAVYGAEFQGRLAALNILPTRLKHWALDVLRLIKPLISVETLTHAIADARRQALDPAEPWSGELFRADPVAGHGAYSAIKRMIDVFAALSILILAGWVLIVIAICIRLDSPGRIIFAQRRVGRGGSEFTCYKFRTMAQGTANAATHAVSARAVTRTGQILRRTKLDELPQAINVLRNEMSLVGPRPCLPIQHELIAARNQRGVLALKPGITGLSQIQHLDMSDPWRLAAADDRYRAFRTLVFDAAILVRTILGGGAGDRIVLDTSPD